MKYLFFAIIFLFSFESYSKIINVKEYGVKGNGTSDDTRAFDMAIEMVSQTSGTLIIPKGNYILNGTSRERLGINGMNYAFLSKGDITISLDPQAVLIYVNGFKGFRFRTVTDPNDKTISKYNIKISGGIIQATKNAVPVKGNPDIYAFAGENLKSFIVNKLTINNINASAGIASYNNEYAEVSGCTFKNVVGNRNDLVDNHGCAIYFNNTKSFSIKNNLIANDISQSGRIGTAGACVEGEKSQNGSIVNNKINGYDRAIHVELITGTANILSNTISGCSSGIVLWNNNGYPQVIKGNFITNVGLSKNIPLILYTNAPILLLGYNTNNGTIIENNDILIDNKNPKDFIPQSLLAITSSHMKLIGNKIIDNTNSINISLAEGVGQTKFVEDIEVSDNVFSCNKLIISDAADINILKNDCTVNNVLFLFNAIKASNKNSAMNKTVIGQNTFKSKSGKLEMDLSGDYKFDKVQNKLIGPVELRMK